jgi:metal-responsive CopG/Arc/MetJ family transcriptional regulator
MARKKMEINEKKSKVTLNINDILLNRIDNLLESGDKRSRLIERLVEKYIEENKHKLN